MTLEQLVEAGAISPLDRHFAEAVCRLAAEDDPLVLLGAAVASRAPANGHICVELEHLGGTAIHDGEGQPLDATWPDPADWIAAMQASRLTEGPLVLQDGDLYLQRYHAYQDGLTVHLRARAATERPPADPDALAALLTQLFPNEESAEQRKAAELAVTRGFSVISGGPGTGKTTTVVKILAALQQQALSAGSSLRILLVAPTGKAAARLSQSIEEQVEQLPEELQQHIVGDAMTIHRALVWRPDRPTQFRHAAHNPLSADVVVVDEASMVDLPLMAKLVDAVRPDARLILLGDRDQLASVEAGAVLGDICNAGEDTSASSAAIRDCVVQLTHSWRFRGDSGIGALARGINAGDAAAALAALDEHPDLLRIDAPEGTRPETLLGTRLLDGYRPVVEARTPRAALTALTDFRVLCAHRRGRFGVDAINGLVRDQLASAGLVPLRGLWYAGRPAIITRNDYALDLFNGDIGVTLEDEDGKLRVHFEGRGGTLRSFHPARLPPCDTVFAMTVHKSQGSEFRRVLMLLPDRTSPILTRELLYTGVTRARESVVLTSSELVLTACIDARIQRASGLRSALWD
ncbi:MAG: exodeoxyribonuclease V subunit alpha [Proteobacteria bacterium]|nr:exodeoxyribonuclease V subunit alpha [Pseudomonadota bacterium]MCP4921450.1 exodeoxyribonuclease V subunit alpha [Pseudomonadota bacterium]